MTMNKVQYLQSRDFIYRDIEREIGLARIANSSGAKELKVLKTFKKLGVPEGGGNFMAALALLCYTEFAGKIKFNNKKANGADCSSKNFNDFFDEIGPEYKKLRSSHNVYDRLRCGLAHEYFVKGNCAIAMFTDAPVGIWFDNTNDHYVIVIEKYFGDFKKAFDKLETDLFNQSPPSSAGRSNPTKRD